MMHGSRGWRRNRDKMRGFRVKRNVKTRGDKMDQPLRRGKSEKNVVL